MRDIKFRAWHNESKQMYWFDIMWGNHDRGNGYIGMVEFGKDRDKQGNYRGNVTLVDPDNCNIMQCTGLKDEKGVEIYECDILIWNVNEVSRTSEVYYDELQACFWMGKDKTSGHLVLNDWMRGEYEIIGNIYETPELLQSK